MKKRILFSTNKWNKSNVNDLKSQWSEEFYLALSYLSEVLEMPILYWISSEDLLTPEVIKLFKEDREIVNTEDYRVALGTMKGNKVVRIDLRGYIDITYIFSGKPFEIPVSKKVGFASKVLSSKQKELLALADKMLRIIDEMVKFGDSGWDDNELGFMTQNLLSIKSMLKK
jgi:hypothetical protein